LKYSEVLGKGCKQSGFWAISTSSVEWTALGTNPTEGIQWSWIFNTYLQGSEQDKNIYMHFFMGRNMLMMMEDLKQAPFKVCECPCAGDLPWGCRMKMFVFSCTDPGRPMTTYFKGQQSNQQPSSVHFWLGFQFIFSYFFSCHKFNAIAGPCGHHTRLGNDTCNISRGHLESWDDDDKGPQAYPLDCGNKISLTMTNCYLKSNVILRPRPLSWSLLELSHMGCLHPLLSQASKVIVSF
jgi:hypothetical protein